MSKSTAAKLYDRMQKIMRWTVAAEDAATRKEAQKALRKVAKHSLKLARLQGRAYTEFTEEENTNDQRRTSGQDPESG